MGLYQKFTNIESEVKTMSNQLQIFNNQKFGQVRTIEANGKVLFVGSDVAKSLGYAIPSKAINTHCKGVSKMEVPTNGGNQEMLVIPEGDIYRLAAKSELPGAEEFESWIFDEVLPSIHKTGVYLAPHVDSKMMYQIAQALEEKERKILELTPAADFGNTVGSSSDSMLIRDYVKVLSKGGIKIPQDKFFTWLYKNRYIYRTKESKPQWKAYSQFTDLGTGIIEMVERPYSTNSHGDKIGFTVKITGKGQKYFFEKLRRAA